MKIYWDETKQKIIIDLQNDVLHTRNVEFDDEKLWDKIEIHNGMFFLEKTEFEQIKA